jgi:hypothetical protein
VDAASCAAGFIPAMSFHVGANGQLFCTVPMDLCTLPIDDPTEKQTEYIYNKKGALLNDFGEYCSLVEIDFFLGMSENSSYHLLIWKRREEMGLFPLECSKKNCQDCLKHNFPKDTASASGKDGEKEQRP